MITQSEKQSAVEEAWTLLKRAGAAVREEEKAHIEAADFGLGELSQIGLQILTLVSTSQLAVKLLVLQPWQVCPQHRHPPVDDYAGKEETFRAIWGDVYVHVPGDPTPAPVGRVPEHRRAHFSAWHEIVLQPGEQYTSPPNEWHWFQAGPQGAVLWSFTSRAIDSRDIFADPQVRRATVVRKD